MRKEKDLLLLRCGGDDGLEVGRVVGGAVAGHRKGRDGFDVENLGEVVFFVGGGLDGVVRAGAVNKGDGTGSGVLGAAGEGRGGGRAVAAINVAANPSGSGPDRANEGGGSPDFDCLDVLLARHYQGCAEFLIGLPLTRSCQQ